MISRANIPCTRITLEEMLLSWLVERIENDLE